MGNYAFIDSQNLYKAIKAQGWAIDYKRLRIYLKDKYDVEKAYLFLGFLPTNECLYTSLQEAGFILIFKPLLAQPNGKIKGNVDAELVLHVMIELKNFKKAVIITGDGDFRCLVEYLIHKDKLLKLLIPDRDNYSSLLRKFRSHIAFMDNLKHKLAYQKDR